MHWIQSLLPWLPVMFITGSLKSSVRGAIFRGVFVPPVLSSFPPTASLWGDVHSECAVAAVEIGLVNPSVRNIYFQARHVCVTSSQPQREWKTGGVFSRVQNTGVSRPRILIYCISVTGFHIEEIWLKKK